MEPKEAREKSVVVRVTQNVLGEKIVNQDGENVGEITELVIDCATGQVTYAILSFGGFLGMGDRLFAVPWVSLGYDPAKNAYTMKVNKELLKNAPGFDKNQWPDMSDPTRLSEVYRYYGAESGWR